MQKSILLPTAYIPNIAYFASLMQATEAWIEGSEHYVKQSYRNRSYILTANGVIRLSIPVLHHGKVPIQELEIDHRKHWQRQHWRAIQSAYAKAPFFEHFEQALHAALHFESPTLFEFNQNLLQTCLDLLRIKTKINVTTRFRQELDKEHWVDGRTLFHPKNPLKASMPSYFQCFGEGFEPNMSIIDLLFCEGPQATMFLAQTRSLLTPEQTL